MIHLFSRITSVQNAERVVRDVSLPQGTEGTEISVTCLTVEHQDVDADAQIILNPDSFNSNEFNLVIFLKMEKICVPEPTCCPGVAGDTKVK